MKSSEQDIRRWVETWKRAGRALEDVRRQELRSGAAWDPALIDAMLQWACDHAPVRLTSGLVEQQRIFRKIHEAEERKSGRAEAGNADERAV